jgi:hypothetical protein
LSRICVSGFGAVSPAGWGVERMRAAIAGAAVPPTQSLARPGWDTPLRVRRVPAPDPRPAFFTHNRLRRASPITQYGVAAGLEALGPDARAVADGRLRLGIVLCVMAGCVNYSRRFYDETLRDPSTASPLVFPETVFNAPASHLAALLGSTSLNYTIVGDPGVFPQGLALAAQWLVAGDVDACLVIGAEESDWLVSDAFRLFSRAMTMSDGAGALCLKRAAPDSKAVELSAISSPYFFATRQARTQAAQQVRAELPRCSDSQILVDGLQGVPRFDMDEESAWRDWTAARLSPKRALGEGLMAASAWQCVAAVDALRQGRHSAASVSVVGCNQQAIGVHFAAAARAG